MPPRIQRIQILRRIVIGIPVELEDARELLGGLGLLFLALLAQVAAGSRVPGRRRSCTSPNKSNAFSKLQTN